MKPPPSGTRKAVRIFTRFLHRERYENGLPSRPTRTAYLTTLSNVIAHVEQGTETIEAVYEWLLNEVASFFKAPKETFAFGGSFWLLEK